MASARGGGHTSPIVLVQAYARELFMGIPLPRPAALAARLATPIEEWPYLDEVVLLKTRSRKVCMTCHWLRHHAGVNCIPVLTSRCQGWTDDLARQQGWAPEVA